MPQADFQVTLQFRGYPVAEGVVGTGSADAWLRDFASAVTQHAHGSGMCSDWRNAFRGDETTAHDLELSEPEVHLFTVVVRPYLRTAVAVNGGRTATEAAEALEGYLRNEVEWNQVHDRHDLSLSEDEVRVTVDHVLSQATDETVPDDYVAVEL
jgi:hypothetical protein